jgi:DNA-binding transcriptional MerR regulator
MYTIKEAASRSGVTVQLLRAWERRYGVVNPARTDSGYRLYDDRAIDRLRAMRRLVDEGWAPSNAAVRIRDLDEAAVGLLASDIRASGMANPRTAAGASELAEAFVMAASKFDERGLEAVLDEMFARGSFEAVATELVMPALVALGEGWQQGRIDVAAEHAAAGAVQRRLGMAFLAAGSPGDDQDVVLVGLPPGARHELGALAFATTARRAGVGVRFLGADLPLQDWLDAAARASAVAVAIGVVVASDVDPAERVGRALRAAAPQMVIAFGGRAAADVDRTGTEPALILPNDLTSAVDVLRAEIANSSGAARNR